ncbi:hypothetical protein KGF57_001070 [Candida theae]|uniref:Uncharacterized protein n=1 Tax=Candida theae TaxID=1198502 RepID=A0AAD5BID6_9ASCO|nr:uncharacterized protein KGF57_001070 [Candida theae]KAI5964397.1 hypothetical protein KGF57_001070 [Candida theae]
MVTTTTTPPTTTTTTSATSTTTTISENNTNTVINQLPTEHRDTKHPQPSRQEIINNLLELARQEQAKGNTSVTSDKLDKLQSVLQNNSPGSRKSPFLSKGSNSYNFDKYQRFQQVPTRNSTGKYANHKIKPKFPPIFDKFDIEESVSKAGPTSSSTTSPSGPAEAKKQDLITISKKNKNLRKKIGGKFYQAKKFTLKQLEFMFINFLETIANLLDNLHLLSNLPMFPQALTKLLKQTNKLWVLILVFLIRKTISQLLNVVRKIRKVDTELKIVNNNSNNNNNNNNIGNVGEKMSNASVFSKPINEDINRKYNKILKDLKFDKMMLIFELVGNFLDLTFNLIELSEVAVPNWIMSGLNVASMGMTIYRMNKDDEYIDDDITEDLI